MLNVFCQLSMDSRLRGNDGICAGMTAYSGNDGFQVVSVNAKYNSRAFCATGPAGNSRDS
jgi:hypothetical protein